MTTNTNAALRSAAESALEALEILNGIDTETESVTIHVSDEIAALRAALTAAAAVPAAGMVTVPEVPDERMERAIAGAFCGTVYEAREAWAAGIAAAPKAEPVPTGEYPPLPEPYHVAYDDIDKEDVKCFAEGQLRAYVDADRAMRASRGQAPAPAAVAGPSEAPEGWRNKFAEAVYADLEAADNQDVPLEEYPARILKALDSIVGPRHPTVIHWRNDAIQACIAIAYKYCRDPESFQYLKQDLQALIFAAPKLAPVAQGDAPTDSGPISRQWLTVVYRGVEAGDEVQQICTHPKVSAMSWSHALHDRDAARSQAKEGGAS